MKRILLFIIVATLAGATVSAQPAKRRTTTSNAAAKRTPGSKTTETKTPDRASLQFPTATTMPEDVVWKRDIYRQLDLLKDKNAPMYYPIEPQGKQMNLFTFLFRLILTGRVQAYAYKLDGNESFEESDRLPVKEMLERYGIYYEEKDGKLTVANSDIPSAEATRYYIKESVYFDQRTGTFSTRVTALCPILMRGADEFSTEATAYPLFWVKYEDIAQYLSRLPMMGSNLNNVTNLTADDYFTLNRYEGQIYKTNNLQGKVLANYCKTDSDMVREQLKIEKQLIDFEKNVWGYVPADTTDSISANEKAEKEKVGRKSKNKDEEDASGSRRRGATVTEKKVKVESAPRVSVRRQRR